MRLITVSGPPSSGKTSVVIRAVEQMGGGEKVMVVKFDCLSSTDQERYQRAGSFLYQQRGGLRKARPGGGL